MNHKSIFRALVFLLLVGPLQVQQVFACGMMDAIFVDCCCEDNNCSADSDSSNAIATENQCCEVSIQLSINIDANSEIDVIKPAEIRSDVDPPAEIVFATALWVEPIRFTDSSNLYSTPSYRAGTTYLITQRLRI